MIAALIVEAGALPAPKPRRRRRRATRGHSRGWRHERLAVAHLPLDPVVGRRSRRSPLVRHGGFWLRRLAAERLPAVDGRARTRCGSALVAVAVADAQPARVGRGVSAPRRSRRSPCSGTPRGAWRRATSSTRRQPGVAPTTRREADRAAGRPGGVGRAPRADGTSSIQPFSPAGGGARERPARAARERRRGDPEPAGRRARLRRRLERGPAAGRRPPRGCGLKGVPVFAVPVGQPARACPTSSC